MENFEDRFEVLHLESDNEINFDFPPLLNDEYEEEDDHFRTAEEGIVNPFLFMSSKYYTFKQDLAEYLISDWKMTCSFNLISLWNWMTISSHIRKECH